MSTDTEHLAIADRNQLVLTQLLRDLDRCSEWAAIVAFYKALHIVEAVFANQSPPVHNHSHHTRLDRLKSTRQFAPLYPFFRTLWAASIVARYLEDRSPLGSRGQEIIRPYSRFDDYLSSDRIQPDLLDRYLQPLENMAASMLPPNTHFARYLHSGRAKPGITARPPIADE